MRDTVETKLSLFCDRIIEAGWLTAAIVVPLLFNFRSAKVFELEKISVLRSVALLMVFGAIIGASERKARESHESSNGTLRQRVTHLVRRPVVLPALALLTVNIVATIVSVWPHGSLWGSYERRQGLYAVLSYVAVFLVMQRILHRQGQVDRLFNLITVTSAVVSLYAIAQRLGLDPMPWAEGFDLDARFGQRVASTLGNPIFTGGYLVMVIPLALSRAIESASLVFSSRENRGFRILSLAFYASIIALHLVALVLTQSRGPFLALLGAFFFFILLWMVCERKAKIALIIIALAVALGLLLIIVNLPDSPLASVRQWPYIGRLTTLLESSTSRSRFLMWEGAVEMATANLGRLIVGYGPEAARVAFYPYITPELADLLGNTLTTGRFHNQTMDTLVETGVLGMVAYLWLFGSLFYHGLKSLGLIDTRRDRSVFICLVCVGVLLGVPSSWLLTESLGLSALTVPAGMIVGVVIYLLFSLFSQSGQELVARRNQLALIAVLSAVTAHFVETQTGIAVTATRSQFWLYGGILGAIALGIDPLPKPDDTRWESTLRRRRGQNKSGKQLTGVGAYRLASLLVYSLSMGVLSITLGFDFVIDRFNLGSYGVILVVLLLSSWFLGAASFLVQMHLQWSYEGESQRQGKELLVYAGVPTGLLAVFIPFHLAAVNSPGASTGVVTVLYFFLFCTMVGIAVALYRLDSIYWDVIPCDLCREARWWVYVGLVGMLIAVVWITNINPVKADMIFARAQIYQGAGRVDQSIPLYRHAVELAPCQDHYHIFLGQAYLRKAVSEPEATWFNRAERVFQKARKLSPLRPDHYANLGLLYYHWGCAGLDVAQAVEKLEKATAYYSEAAAMSPYTQGRLLESWRLDAHLALANAYVAMGQVDQAIEEAGAAKMFATAEEIAEVEERISNLLPDESDN